MASLVKPRPFITCNLMADSVDALEEDEWWLEPEERRGGGGSKRKGGGEGVTSKKKRRKITDILKASKVIFVSLPTYILSL